MNIWWVGAEDIDFMAIGRRTVSLYWHIFQVGMGTVLDREL